MEYQDGQFMSIQFETGETYLLNADSLGKDSIIDTSEFDKARERVCKIFQDQIEDLNREINQIPMVNQQYWCSKRSLFDISTLGCCTIMCIPLIWGSVSSSLLPATFIATELGAETCAIGCCGAACLERGNIMRWEQSEADAKTKQIEAIKSQRKFIQSDECKQFCLDHKFKNLTALLQHRTFPSYMQTCLEIKRLTETPSPSFDINNADHLQERLSKVSKIESLRSNKLALEQELEAYLI